MNKKMKEYRITAVSNKRGTLKLETTREDKKLAMEKYRQMVYDIEEEQGMSMNITGVWELRLPVSDYVIAEKIECCDGDIIEISVRVFNVKCKLK